MFAIKKMEFSAAQIAKMINGTIEGDSDVIISKFSKIEEADIGSLTFLANTKYSEYLYTTKASIIIINKDFELKSKVSSTLIRVPDAYSSVAFLLDLYNKNIENKQGIEQPSFISSSAKIGENVYIGAFSYIGENVKIGNNSKIYPNTHVADNSVVGDGTILYQGVKLYRNSQVGNNCIIHAGVVIGADGFGFAPDKNNVYHKVPQTGNVIIEDNVEIGANSCVDKATLGSTIIRKGVKIDNLVMIAHNVEIKENTVIVAQTGISGSVKIGKNCIIGGQVGIAGHLTIADEVKIQAQSGIASSINEKASVVQGSPAFNIMDFKRAYVLFRKLPKLFSKLD